MIVVIRTDSKAINFMSLLIETDDGVLVDIVRGDNGEFVEPGDPKVGGHPFKRCPGQAG